MPVATSFPLLSLPTSDEESSRERPRVRVPAMPRRGRVQLRRIEDKASRQVRFSKRRAGLFKKAFELAVLCDADVALLVFSPGGRLYEYSSSSIETTYSRYKQFAGGERNNNEGDANEDSNNNREEHPSDLQSRLMEIACWSLQKNADQSDVSELEKLEKLLTDALRHTKSRKMAAKENVGGRTSGEHSNEPRRAVEGGV